MPAKRASDTPQRPQAFLDWLDDEARAFSGATTREYYVNSAGLKDELSLAPIFRKHRRLFHRETVDRVLALRSKDARLESLREFVVQGYLEQAAKEKTEELAARETGDAVQWDKKRIPYRSIQMLLMNEDDGARRHKLDRLRLEATSGQNQLRQQRWDLVYDQSKRLGFKTYVELCDRIGRLDLERLRETMERFLWETDKAYRQHLERELRAIAVLPARAERSDLLRLFRLTEFDGAFPKKTMLPSLDTTLRGLGIEPGDQPNVILDTEARPRKSPRAFCAPVDVPKEIYLVISPHGGPDDYRALFHEAGHAQHFAHVNGNLPYAHAGLGDNSVTEGFAFVLEHVLYSPAWLRAHLPLRRMARYLSFTRFHKLYYLRRYAAKLLYELELHGGGDPRAGEKRYADLLTAHVGVRYDPEDYLSDLDDAFYCARYLRAWIFDAQVRAWFTRRWGDAWFRNPHAGAHLRELWSYGQRYRAEEILQQLDEPGLDIGPLLEEAMVTS
jgi:hypothetical protein